MLSRPLIVLLCLLSFAVGNARASEQNPDDVDQLRAKIEKLEAKIEKLEAKNEKLEEDNAALREENEELKNKATPKGAAGAKAKDARQAAQPDKFQAGSKWKGKYQRLEMMPGAKKPSPFFTDARLSVLSRDGAIWSGELWMDGRTMGMRVGGKIDRQGQFTMEFIQELGGKWRKDLIGNAIIRGVVARSMLDCKMEIPGVNLDAEWTLQLEK